MGREKKGNRSRVKRRRGRGKAVDEEGRERKNLEGKRLREKTRNEKERTERKEKKGKRVERRRGRWRGGLCTCAFYCIMTNTISLLPEPSP